MEEQTQQPPRDADTTGTRGRSRAVPASAIEEESTYTLGELLVTHGDGLAGAAHLAGLGANARLTRSQADELLRGFNSRVVEEGD